jgi:hypothetical protein
MIMATTATIEERTMTPPLNSTRPFVLALLSTTLLGGCASFSPDGGFDAIESATRSQIQKDVVWSRDDDARKIVEERVDALLAQPLSVDDAVQVALLNNPGLQAALNTLGIAEADWVSAQRLPNLGFSIGRFARGSEVEWEYGLQFSLIQLLTMPMRADIEQRLFEQTRLDLSLEVLRLAADARKAWLILYTHDVSDTPSQWGCSTAALERLVDGAVNAGFDVVTVAEGARRIGL